MPPHSLSDKIRQSLSLVGDDEEKLSRILSFPGSEILPGTEEKEDEIIIPEKYEKVVKDIAGRLQLGSPRMTYYLNVDTLDTENLPESYEYCDWLGETDENGDPVPEHTKWDNYITFEPPDSRESFRIMADFAKQLDNTKVGDALIDILNQRKPFAHFNSFIHNSIYLQDWHDFKNKAYEKYVKEILRFGLKKLE